MSNYQPQIKKRRKRPLGYFTPEHEKRRRMDAKRRKTLATMPQTPSQIRPDSDRCISPTSIHAILDEESGEDVKRDVVLPSRPTNTNTGLGVKRETCNNNPPVAKRPRPSCGEREGFLFTY